MDQHEAMYRKANEQSKTAETRPVVDLPIYSTGDVAKLAGVEPRQVRRWCENGRVKAKRLGKDWVITDIGGVIVKAAR